jgi:hypothetical protein
MARKSVFPPGFRTDQILSITVEARHSNESSTAIVTLKTGESFTAPIGEVQKIFVPEKYTVEISLGVGFKSSYDLGDLDHEEESELSPIERGINGVNLFLLQSPFPEVEDFIALKEEALRACESPDEESAKKFILAWPFKYSSYYVTEHLARICMVLAQCEKAYANGDEQRAQHLLDTANELISSVVAHLKEIAIDARGKGGKATGDKHRLVKEECIRLLSLQRPNGGWKSFMDAADTIERDLYQFVLRHSEAAQNLGSRPEMPGDKKQMHGTILGWLARDSSVRDAYYNQSGGPSLI